MGLEFSECLYFFVVFCKIRIKNILNKVKLSYSKSKKAALHNAYNKIFTAKHKEVIFISIGILRDFAGFSLRFYSSWNSI